MALDRQSIEKRDFPIARRGYDPAAVDAHLAGVAAEVAMTERDTRRSPGTGAASLASAASEQVRAIVDAAERSAAEIERQAAEAARAVDDEARSDAQRTRTEAIERAQDHVGKVSQATSLMLQRVDAMESELSALIESLRTGANRLSADLALLEGNMSELYGAASVGTMPEGQSRGPQIATPSPKGDAQAVGRDAVPAEIDTPGTPEPVEEAGIEAADGPEPASPTRVVETSPAEESSPAGDEGGGSADAEGARLIALNMALNGQSREETERYLAENFDLADRASLVDEVYSSLE